MFDSIRDICKKFTDGGSVAKFKLLSTSAVLKTGYTSVMQSTSSHVYNFYKTSPITKLTFQV